MRVSADLFDIRYNANINFKSIRMVMKVGRLHTRYTDSYLSILLLLERAAQRSRNLISTTPFNLIGMSAS